MGHLGRSSLADVATEKLSSLRTSERRSVGTYLTVGTSESRNVGTHLSVGTVWTSERRNVCASEFLSV